MERIVNWYKQSLKTDEKELEQSKKYFIEEIKGLTKQDLFSKPEKLTLWKKIKKMLNF
jgi:hypothetical protein